MRRAAGLAFIFALCACGSPDGDAADAAAAGGAVAADVREAEAEAADAAPAITVENVGEGLTPAETSQTFPALDPLTEDLWFSVIETSFDDQAIMVAPRTADGWGPAERVPFSGEWGDRAPRFSPDGAAIYITSNRPLPGETEAGDMNIWRVPRTSTGWGRPELVDSAVNSEAQDIHPSVSASAIWVASSREGGFGRSDLYRVGEDGEVRHPGAPLNDALSQPDLWISPDETWMILAITDHPGGYGGDDLYVSRREGAEWSAPVNLGPEINTPEYEYGPWVSADGAYLLFTSHRDGPSRVYRVGIEAVHEALQDR